MNPPLAKRGRGRPRKIASPPVASSPGEPVERKNENSAAKERQNENSAPPLVREEVRPSDHGHTRYYVREGQELDPAEPDQARPLSVPEFVPSIEISVTSDKDQRAIVDEYGELDRRMQLRAFDTARYDVLKRAIKSWFDNAPADADGTVEGDVYLLHLSARERERRVRSMRELVDVIGLDAVLELASVAIGALENRIGKAEVAKLTVDARTGSRRIKAIPKQAAGRELNGTQ